MLELRNLLQISKLFVAMQCRFIGCILKEEKDAVTGGDRLYVHYIGWDTKWRAWIPRSPSHIQPLGRETAGTLLMLQ